MNNILKKKISLAFCGSILFLSPLKAQDVKFAIQIDPSSSGVGDANIANTTFKEAYFPPNSYIPISITTESPEDIVKSVTLISDKSSETSYYPPDNFKIQIKSKDIIAKIEFEKHDKYLNINHNEFFNGICVNFDLEDSSTIDACLEEDDFPIPPFPMDQDITMRTEPILCSNYEIQTFLDSNNILFTDDLFQYMENCHERATYCRYDDIISKWPHIGLEDIMQAIGETFLPDNCYTQIEPPPNGCYDPERDDFFVAKIDEFEEGAYFYQIETRMNQNRTINIMPTPLPDETPCVDNGLCFSGKCEWEKVLTVNYNETQGDVYLLGEHNPWDNNVMRSFGFTPDDIILVAKPKLKFQFAHWTNPASYRLYLDPFIVPNWKRDNEIFNAVFETSDNIVTDEELEDYFFIDNIESDLTQHFDFGDVTISDGLNGQKTITINPNTCWPFTGWKNIFGKTLSPSNSYSFTPTDQTRIVGSYIYSTEHLKEKIVETFKIKNTTAYYGLFKICYLESMIDATGEAFTPENSDSMIKFIDASIDNDYLASLILMVFFKKQAEWYAQH